MPRITYVPTSFANEQWFRGFFVGSICVLTPFALALIWFWFR